MHGDSYNPRHTKQTALALALVPRPLLSVKKKHLIVHKQPCTQPDIEKDETPAEATETSSEAPATASDDNDGLPVVRNLFDWLQPAFIETD